MVVNPPHNRQTKKRHNHHLNRLEYSSNHCSLFSGHRWLEWLMLLFAHVQHMSSQFGPVISSSFVFARTAAAISAAILQVLSWIFYHLCDSWSRRPGRYDRARACVFAFVCVCSRSPSIARAPVCSRLFAFVCVLLRSRARLCVRVCFVMFCTPSIARALFLASTLLNILFLFLASLCDELALQQ